jgi:hypothetical protein
MSGARRFKVRRINTAGRARSLALKRDFREITMPTAFRHGAILLTLIGTAALTTAHQIGSGPDRRASLGRTSLGQTSLGQTSLGQMLSVDATSSIDSARQHDWIELSDEERGLLFLGVMNLADVPDAQLPVADQLFGSPVVLPASVELQDLPAMVTRMIPPVRHYKFVKLDDRILVVRPADRVVVSEIPRYRLLP